MFQYVTLCYTDSTLPLFVKNKIYKFFKNPLNFFTTHIQSSGQSGPELNLFLNNVPFMGQFESAHTAM